MDLLVVVTSVGVNNAVLEEQITVNLASIAVTNSFHSAVVIKERQVTVTIIVLEPANTVENVDSVVALDGLGRHLVLTFNHLFKLF